MSSRGIQSRRSVLPFSFSTSITGVAGGLTKRKTTMERRTICDEKQETRDAPEPRMSMCLLVRFLVRSPDTA